MKLSNNLDTFPALKILEKSAKSLLPKEMMGICKVDWNIHMTAKEDFGSLKLHCNGPPPASPKYDNKKKECAF